MGTPVMVRSNSEARWTVPPAPGVTYISPPCRRRPRSSSSPSVDTPRDGGTTTTFGTAASITTGERSRSGSTATSLEIRALITCVPGVPTIRVWPSLLRATASAATFPPAPVRFSTTTETLSAAVRGTATSRARMSEVPPAEKGTTRRIVRFGQAAWARVACGMMRLAMPAVRAAPTLRRDQELMHAS
nr:hypothetical protein [Pseudoroseomonas wenyumeiae]